VGEEGVEGADFDDFKFVPGCEIGIEAKVDFETGIEKGTGRGRKGKDG